MKQNYFNPYPYGPIANLFPMGVVVMSLLVMMCSNFLNLFLRKSHSSVAKLWFANLQVPGSIPVAVNFSLFFKYYFNYVYLTVLISYKYGRPLFENGRVKAFTTGENNFLDIRILFEKNLVPPRFEPSAPDPKSGVLTS